MQLLVIINIFLSSIKNEAENKYPNLYTLLISRISSNLFIFHIFKALSSAEIDKIKSLLFGLSKQCL